MNRDAASFERQDVNRTSGRFTSFVRRSLRTLGILMMIVMGAFLFSQHLLRPTIPMESFAQAGGPQTTDEDAKLLIVCFGYADLDEGITALHPSQPGRVNKILVRENEAVPAGAPLLQLDDSAARLRVEETKSLLDEANARLAKAEKAPQEHRLKIAEQQAAVDMAHYRLSSAQHTLALRQERLKGERIGRIHDDPARVEEVKSTVERIKEFEKAVAQEEKKLAALELQDPLIDLESAKADAAATRARWLQAKQTLEEHTLKAPEAGTVLRISVSPSEFLTTPPKRMAIQFCPNRPRVIRAEVEQSFATRLEVGQTARIEDDGSSKCTWRGHVMRISDWYTERRQIAEENLQLKDVRTLECVISLDPGQQPLRIGQRVRVTISRLDS